MTPRTLNLVFDHKPILVFVLENWPPYFWKPYTSDYVAAGAFFLFQKSGPHMFGSPTCLTALPQTVFFFRKMGPILFKPYMSDYVAAGALFFFRKNGSHIFEVTWVCLVWVCDPPFDKNRGHKPTLGSLVWVCDTHVRQGVRGE